MNESQKRDAMRDFVRSAVLPLIEEVLVKKFVQTMDVIAEENSQLQSRLAAGDEEIQRLRERLAEAERDAERLRQELEDRDLEDRADGARQDWCDQGAE